MSDRDERVDEIVRALQAACQRATYGAVAGVVGSVARAVMQGRPRTPVHSWVVSKRTHMPSGYAESERHADLRRSAHVIEDATELAAWLRERVKARSW